MKNQATEILPRGGKRQLPEITPLRWFEKRTPVREIGPTPAFNKEGFWKKPEPPKIKVGKDGGE